VGPDGATPGTLWLADGGALRCRTARGLYVLPSTLALWAPAGVQHQVQGLGGARLRCLDVTLDADAVDGADAGASCRVVIAGALLPALAAMVCDTVDEQAPQRRRLALALVREELQAAAPVPIGVALPGAAALRAACEAVLHEGGSECSLQLFADALGVSSRAMARRFKQELSVPFSQWRLQVRLARAVQLWAEGRTLSASAAAVGYASPSAFSFMVRRVVGMTPRRFLAAARRR
jgi:AraC-like DNA-binding protein